MLKEKHQRSRTKYLPDKKDDQSNFISTLDKGLTVPGTSGNNRKKRQAIDMLTQREIKCEPLWGGTAGYWVYTHEVPKYCFRKLYNS